jgi:hypothetical protein
MLIEIPDEESDKINCMNVKLALYALEKFNYVKLHAAKFIGISPRTLRMWVNRYPELHPYKVEPPYKWGGNEKWGMYNDTNKWKTREI